jgi:hypothetical protein
MYNTESLSTVLLVLVALLCNHLATRDNVTREATIPTSESTTSVFKPRFVNV